MVEIRNRVSAVFAIETLASMKTIKEVFNMDTVNEYLKRTLKTVNIKGTDYTYQNNRPHVECADGFKVSIQASRNHYCSPRVDGDIIYDEVELGYPNTEEPELLEYAEDPDRLKSTVYGYVPVELVNKIIEKHGGIVDKKD